MLVLSATYMSPLRELVDEKLLERLLRRTIGFLIQSENISPTLRADARILTEIYQKIFNRDPDMNGHPIAISSHTPIMGSHPPGLNGQSVSMSFP
jgi:hypothetical protein